MSQGNDLSNYAPASAQAEGPDEDVWFVAVASDDIRQMSVDDLDDALNAGLISAETAVWQDGMEAWSTLGEVAGLDEDDDAETSVVGTDYAAAEYASPEHAAGDVAPQAVAGGHAAPAYADPTRPAVVSQRASGAAEAPRQPSTSQTMPPQSSFMPGQSSLAPVAGPAGAFGQSTVPVALNVDEEMPPIRTGRRFRPERWLLAAAGIAAVGVTLYNNDVFSPPGEADAKAAEAPKAFAARPYEAGGVDKGAELATGAATQPSSAKRAAADDDSAAAPIGSAVGSEPDEDEAPAEKAEAAAPPKKKSLRSSSSYKKRATRAKAKRKRRAKKRRVSRASTKRATKKPRKKRAASAFDPLNGSLP